MANIYVRSTDGDNANDGSTWALAKATLAGAAAIEAAGDTIYVSQAHAESTSALQSIALVNANNNPVRIVCGNDAAEPPTAVAATGVVETGSGPAWNITLSDSGYFYGLTFKVGGAGSSQNQAINVNPYSSGSRLQEYENCVFNINATGSAANLSWGGVHNTTASKTKFKNCDVRLAGTGANNTIRTTGTLIWDGGAFLAGGSNSNPLFINVSNTARSSVIQVSNVDFSAMTATRSFFNAAGEIRYGELRNCKLPTSWTGSLTSGTFLPYPRFAMYNCDSGDTSYKLWIETYGGSIKDETTIVRTGGASDGTTTLAWKLATSANANYLVAPLVTDEIVRWNETVASAITATVEIVHDSQGAGTGADFTDEEIWLEVMYLGTSGVPLGSFISNAKADVLATPADHTNSSETWTTTGLTTPVKQKLSVTFTPQEKGFIHAKVYLGKASKTVYVDPLITVT